MAENTRNALSRAPLTAITRFATAFSSDCFRSGVLLRANGLIINDATMKKIVMFEHDPAIVGKGYTHLLWLSMSSTLE